MKTMSAAWKGLPRRTRRLLWVLLFVATGEAAVVVSWLWLTRPLTRFAPRYNEAVFRSVPLGCTEDYALRALGPPLQTRRFERERFESGQVAPTVVWYYSQSLSKNFSVRSLVFSEKHLLLQKVSYEIAD
jgi:hypothetical protein